MISDTPTKFGVNHSTYVHTQARAWQTTPNSSASEGSVKELKSIFHQMELGIELSTETLVQTLGYPLKKHQDTFLFFKNLLTSITRR